MILRTDLASRWGVEADYIDAFGQRQSVTPEAIERILDVIGAAEAPPDDPVLPAVIIARRGHAARLSVAGLAPDAPILWNISAGEETVAHGTGPTHDCRLPDTLPFGRYTLRIWFSGTKGIENHAALLLVAPERTFQGSDPEARTWVLAVQLYGVRSNRNWGHGDFTDLAKLIDLAAELGAGGIGLNPLHALFDDRPEQASPYAPSSRLFLNALYIDVEAIEEFPGLDARGRKEVTRLRGAEHVAYRGVAKAKLAGLRLAYARFRAAASPERQRDFEQFKQERGQALAHFAAFEVLRRRFSQVWWEWPEEWRKPSEAALSALRATDGEALGFYEFVQWVAERQLAACQARARARGMPVGLYLDVAVGVDAGGADAWAEQGAILHGLSAGAPPDQFNPGGQNWGIAAFHPRGLSAEGFEPFRRTIAAAMRHAGAIRIDHVLGLNRLFLVPHGASPRDGAYFRFPLEALLAVVAQESVTYRCLVIGEDLGTVPPELRDKLGAWGLWSYRLLLFERYQDGLFIAPERYPAMALATFSTHDLPTFAGWKSGHDIAVRRRLDMPSGENEADRARSCQALHGALAYAGIDDPDEFVAIARYLAATPSRLVAISMEDVLGIIDQPNLPGTVDEHPNWRQRLPLPLENWTEHAQLQALGRVFAQSGRGAPTR
jgi:4-alpha-glucanotransferase